MTAKYDKKEKIIDFLYMHAPIGIKPKSKKAKTTFVYPFSSGHAMDCVLQTLADAICEHFEFIGTEEYKEKE